MGMEATRTIRIGNAAHRAAKIAAARAGVSMRALIESMIADCTPGPAGEAVRRGAAGDDAPAALSRL